MPPLGFKQRSDVVYICLGKLLMSRMEDGLERKT